jgi:ferredoxin
MPVVTFYHEHRSHEVESGANLRSMMLDLHLSPYTGIALITNCRGHNFCGTCAVEIVDGKGASPRGQDEEATLAGNLAVARVVEKNVRLACQTRVLGDMTVKTHPVRMVDKALTQERIRLAGITMTFLLVFGGVLAALFLDMIKLL